MNKKYIVIGAIVLVVAGLIVGMMVSNNSSQSLGATGTRFPNGISTNSTSPSAGQVRSTTLTVTGASTLAAVSGTTGTFTGFGKFGNAASSTVQIGAASKSGCLILGDEANAASVVYITATGATITASTTKPAACQTAQ